MATSLSNLEIDLNRDILELNDTLDTLITGDIIFDKFRQRRYTSFVDYKLKLKFFEPDNIDNPFTSNHINENALMFFTDRSPVKTEYVHLNTLDSELEINFGKFSREEKQNKSEIDVNSDDYRIYPEYSINCNQYIPDHIPTSVDHTTDEYKHTYVVQATMNILLNSEMDEFQYRRPNEICPMYSCFVNHVHKDSYLIDLETQKNIIINNEQEKVRTLTYKLNKGWNRIDWFILQKYYEQTDNITLNGSYIFKTGFNPVFEINQDSTYLRFLNKQTLLYDIQIDSSNIRDNTLLVTALFPDTSKLIVPNEHNSFKYNINTYNDPINTYEIQQEIVEDQSYEYYFTCNISINHTLIDSNAYYPDLSDFNTQLMYIDNVVISNLSTESNLYIDRLQIINSNISDTSQSEILYDSTLHQYIKPSSEYTYTYFNKDNPKIDLQKTLIMLFDFPDIEQNSDRFNIDMNVYYHINNHSARNKLHISNSHSLECNKFMIQSDGSVGIGTNNTKDYSLYVNNISYNRKGIFCADDITVLSDRNHKTDIQPIENPLQKLINLKGVTYKRTDRTENSRKMGFIAQEVKEVVPEACDGDSGIKPTDLVSLIVEGIKDLITKNDLKV